MSFLFFIIGLCFGSFVNMLVFRTSSKSKVLGSKLRRTNILTFLGGRSVCDHCGKELNWWNNIPILSFLFQKGKSQCCGKKLDWSYPLVELLMGVLFLVNFLMKDGLSFTWQFLIFNFVLVLIIYSALYDAKTMYLPDWSTYTLIFLSLFFIRGIDSLYSAIGASLFLYLLSLIRIKGKEGMGSGDVLLAIFMGLLLGWPNILIAFYVAFIAGAVFSISYLWVLNKKVKGAMIPFGPFLLLGTLVAWWWGESLCYYFIRLIS